MAKINIKFNNTDYQIDESSLSAASTALKQHLSAAMNGTGATINLGGTTYNIDATKLSTAKNEFVAHLGTISGDGMGVVVDGIEYSVGSDKVASAIFNLETALNRLQDGLGGSEGSGDSGETSELVAGLYETGSNYTVLLKDWDTLVSENLVSETGAGIYENREQLAGDLVFADTTTSSGLTRYSGFHNLTGAVIPGSVGVLNNKTLFNCRNLTNLYIGDGVTSVGTSSFEGTNLKSVSIPDSINYVGNLAFTGYLFSTYNEYGNSFYLGNESNPYVALIFVRNRNATSIDIHPNCKAITGGALSGCQELTSITIPDGIVYILGRTFYGCNGLTEVFIPNSIKNIEYQAFASCTNLSNFTFGGTIEEWNAVTKSNDWNSNVPATYVQCSDGTVEL